MPGPKARSQRRTSSTRAASAGIVAIGAPSHDSVGTHEYWLLTHVPRGRPRTTVPAAPRTVRTRVETPTVPAHDFPSP